MTDPEALLDFFTFRDFDHFIQLYLAEHQIPIEICPTSNIATRSVASYDVHPLRAMVEAGLLVTINSDDPHMFGTTLCREYEIAADLLDLDEAGIAQLAKNAVAASFLPGPDKEALVTEIDLYVAGHQLRSAPLTGDLNRFPRRKPSDPRSG